MPREPSREETTWAGWSVTVRGSISNSYSTASVSTAGSGSFSGGLAGYFESYSTSLSNSYAIGPVSGGLSQGGILAGGASTVSASYWDTDTTGQGTSAGGGVTGESDSAMKMQSTYSGWDFTGTWQMGTYPLLRGMPSCSDGTSGTCYYCGDGTASIDCGTSCSSDAACPSGSACVSNGGGGGFCHPGADPGNTSCTSDSQCAVASLLPKQRKRRRHLRFR